MSYLDLKTRLDYLEDGLRELRAIDARFVANERVIHWWLVTIAFIGGLLLGGVAFGAQPSVIQTKTSPDGQWRVEVADFARRQVFELWSTPAVGGVRRKIGHTTPALEDVANTALISADSRRVIYTQGETASGNGWGLWSTPIDRQAGARISQPMTTGGRVEQFTLTADGMHVRYRADVLIDEHFAWYIVPVAGGPILGEIFTDGFESGTPGGWQ